MKVRVIFYPDLSFSEGSLSILCPDVNVPKGFSIKGGERKFVVLKGKKELIVAIGPLLSDNYYYHKAILAAAENKFGHLTISGGGSIEFKKHGDEEWKASFNGSSGDFGVFDPIILTKVARKAISKAIGIRVSFEWIG